MESAIPAHMRVERVHPPRKSTSFRPPYPSFSARFDPAVEQVVMAYLGVQYATPQPPTVVTIALAELLANAHGVHGPDHRDQARLPRWLTRRAAGSTRRPGVMAEGSGQDGSRG